MKQLLHILLYFPMIIAMEQPHQEPKKMHTFALINTIKGGANIYHCFGRDNIKTQSLFSTTKWFGTVKIKTEQTIPLKICIKYTKQDTEHQSMFVLTQPGSYFIKSEDNTIVLKRIGLRDRVTIKAS